MAARSRFGISAIAVLVIGLFAVCVCAEHRPDEILIKYKVGRKAQAQLSVRSVNAQPAQAIDQIRFQRFKLPKWLSVEQAIARFSNDPNVEYVGPVNIIRPCLTPNDELYVNGMTITTEDIFGDIITETYTQWWLGAANGIDAIHAWDVDTGETSNMVIAIVDSGVMAGHEDLAGKMIAGYNAIHGEETTTQYDDVGHGTQVAGVAAAMTNNTTGMAGVCWGARIMPVKIIKVTGTLATASGERAIQSATLTKLNTTTPPNPLKPIGMTTKAVGGARIGYKSGITNGVGTNNVGLLVTVYGKVTAVGWTYFYIDDGASMRDGSGMRGLKVVTGNLTKPAEGDYVRVTGIVSIEQPPDAGVSIPVIRARRQSDWVKVH